MKKINYLVQTWVPLFYSSGSGSELTHFLLNEISLIRIFSYISLLYSYISLSVRITLISLC